MELGFSLGNAGPLSQISVHIFTLDTAINIATGAYGWWKARERTASLIHVIAAKGGQLVATSSFNWETYNLCRQHGIMQGLVVQSGELQTTTLPKASTATPDQPDQACLRALATGLLCFYGVDATTVILADLVPFGLLQYDQEESNIKIEGPLLSSLKQWVSAVSVEEDNNTFRQYVMDQVSRRQQRFVGAPIDDIVNCEPGLTTSRLWWGF